MSITVVPKGAKSTNGNFGGLGNTNTIASVPLGTGDILVFITGDPLNPDPVSATVGGSGGSGGVAATFIGKTTDNQGWAYLAQGVNTATGDIVIGHNFGFNLESVNWQLITGEDVASAVFTFVSKVGNGNDPQAVSGTIPAGGVGLIAIGTNGNGASNNNPTTWVGCVSSGNTTLEDVVTTGNGSGIAGNYSTTAGSGPFTASGGGATYLNNNIEMMMVTFAALGGGGGSPQQAGIIGMASNEW